MNPVASTVATVGVLARHVTVRTSVLPAASSGTAMLCQVPLGNRRYRVPATLRRTTATAIGGGGVGGGGGTVTVSAPVPVKLIANSPADVATMLLPILLPTLVGL